MQFSEDFLRFIELELDDRWFKWLAWIALIAALYGIAERTDSSLLYLLVGFSAVVLYFSVWVTSYQLLIKYQSWMEEKNANAIGLAIASLPMLMLYALKSVAVDIVSGVQAIPG